MRDIPTSPRIIELKRKTRKKFLRLFVLSLILFVSIIIGLSYFSNDRHLIIDSINIEGTNIIDVNNVNSFIKEKLSGKYFYLFNRANGLVYPEGEIYYGLLKEFPRIEELNVSRVGFNTLNIKIKERAGSFLYCGLSLPEDLALVGENCYFVNNDGYVFDKAPYFSGDIYFKFYLSIEGGQSDPLKKNILDKNKFYETIRFIDGLNSLGLKPVYVVVDNSGVYSIYLEKRGNINNPKIILNETDSLDSMLNNISLAMGESEFANEIKERYDTLSYIDLRFDNKVIYKFE